MKIEDLEPQNCELIEDDEAKSIQGGIALIVRIAIGVGLALFASDAN